MQRLLVILVLVTSASAVLAADKPARIAGAPPPEVTAPADVSVEATGASTPVRPGEISGSFPVGKTIIKWTATDEHGNTTSGTHTVIVADTTVPKVIAPADVSIEATGPTTSVELGAAVAEDIVDGDLLPQPDTTGPFSVGTHTITWRVTDAAGNTGSATQTLTITDKTAPVVTPPAAITLEATGAATAIDLGAATATDIVDGDRPPQPDQTGPFSVGTHTITWSVPDAAGNLGKATQTITVSDTTAPDVTPPADITVEATGAKTPIAPGVAAAVDIVDGALTAKADQTGPFSVGVHTLTWSIKDKAGNTGSATQTLTITDTTAPAITAPADIAVEASGALTDVKLGVATATDSVDGKLTPTADTTGPFTVGAHTVTWSITDTAGNTGSAVQRLLISDTTAPKVSAPAAITLEASGPETPVEAGTAAATDIVDGDLLPQPDTTGPFSVGTHTITWSVTDAAGNTGSATQTLTITDKTAPVVTPPAAITLEATGAATAIDLGAATATDIVDGDRPPQPDQTGPFSVGTHTITWSVPDAAGNLGKATQTITVSDTTAPDVTPPADITVEATGAKTPIAPGVAAAVDIVDGALTAKADQTGPFSVGVHTLTWSIKDKAGNTGSATQTLTITDTTAPAITAPADIAVEASGALTDVKLGVATATDSVDGKLTPTADTTGPFTVGAHTVTWSITDTAGNTVTVTQKVTVTDTTAPRVAPPPAVVIEGTDLKTPVDPGIATAVDLVDGAVSPAPDVTGPFAVGEHTITWSVQDQAGNTGSATQKITVRDTIAPVITVPGDIITEATNLATPVVLGNATATDIVDSKPAVTNDAPGTFPVGTTQVTWKATDFTGNVVSVKQRVTITDTTPPMVNPPRDITIEATGAVTGVELGEAVASDLVDGNLAAKPDKTGPFVPGVHTVTWRATDKAGNTGSAEQPVTVTDKTPPRIVAEADITIEATGPATPATLKVSAEDMVDGAMRPTSDAPDAYPVGTTAVTWTVTDKAGNNSSVARKITVVDTTSPLITVPADVRVEATGAVTAVDLGSATATDKVDGALAPAPDQTGPFAPGVHTITWSVSDRAGNLNTATQRVFVSDKTVPVVMPPPDVALEAAGRATSVDLGVATAVDLVDGNLAAKPDQAGPFAVGVHKITWSATDAATNTGKATQTVTVVDTTAPVLMPPADVTLEATGAKTEVALGDATATDSVDGALKATPDHIGAFAPGAHTVTWRVADAAGNASTATQAVTITDRTAPTISAPKDLTVEATGPLTAINLGKATATDNIDGALSPAPDQAGPFAPGSYTVTWRVTDSTGNTATAIQRVTVTDTTPPEIVVPEDVVTEATGQKTTVDPGEARAVDLVDGEVAVASDAPAVYPIDTTVISWHAKDRAGNESSLTQFVTVEDRGSPVVTPPADITVESDGDETDVELGAATAVDVIDGELDAKPDKTGPFKIGVHKVTWTATDSSGKKGTATQQVTVVAPAAKPVTAMEKDQAPAAEAAVPASE